MTVTLRIPAALRDCCAGETELCMRVATVREALAVLERDHPKLHVRVCDETGAVRRHLNVFVNRSHIRDLEGLESRVEDGDVLAIMQAVSGG